MKNYYGSSEVNISEKVAGNSDFSILTVQDGHLNDERKGDVCDQDRDNDQDQDDRVFPI